MSARLIVERLKNAVEAAPPIDALVVAIQEAQDHYNLDEGWLSTLAARIDAVVAERDGFRQALVNLKRADAEWVAITLDGQEVPDEHLSQVQDRANDAMEAALALVPDDEWGLS